MLAAALAAVLAACSPQQLLVKQAADVLSAQAEDAEADLELARDAAAFYLKLSESLLKQTPGHTRLAESVAAGFTQYAYAFVAFEGDKLEARDSRAAQRLHARAARLYKRANAHAMAGLIAHHPGLAQGLQTAAGSTPPAGALSALPTEHVGLAYWAAASWGAYIALSKDKPDDVADLPQVVRLATLAWQTDPNHGQGALASLMGSLESARPGGSREQATRYFERAVALGAGRQAGVFVAMAETLAQPEGDRAGFERLLQQALAASDAHPNLANAALRERARWLLATVDERF